jgi:hypothetical protein
MQKLSGPKSLFGNDDDSLTYLNQGLGFDSPTMVGAAAPLTNALYLTEAGNTSAITISDINQGQIGDCFLLSSIGEIARINPAFISNMIHLNADGTESVTLYKASNGSLAGWSTTAFKAATVTVTNSFQSNSVNSGATQDVAGKQKEIWTQVLEKADATLNGGVGLNSIANGGYPVLAMEALTGHTASYATPQMLTYASLLADTSAKDLLVFDTPSYGALSNGLYNSHAYMFDHMTGTNASNAMVYLDNPWGFAEPTPIAFGSLSKVITEIDIGHLS